MAFSLARVRPAYLAALPPAREAPVAHYWSLLRYALRRVGDEPTARDVVADTFTVAWRRWEQVPPDPLPWLYGVARRVIAAERRRQQRADSLSWQLSMRPAPTGDAEQLRETLDALVTLRPTDQEVLLLHVWEGLTGPSSPRPWAAAPCPLLVDSDYTGLPTRYIQIYDPDDGRLFATEDVLTADAGKLNVPIPSVISYETFLEST